MTKLIIGGRNSGKSIELIKKSAETGIYILVKDSRRARVLFDQAKSLGYESIPYPVTLREYFDGHKFAGSIIRKRGLFIDDADDVIREIFRGINIHAVTATGEEWNSQERWLAANPHLKVFRHPIDREWEDLKK